MVKDLKMMMDDCMVMQNGFQVASGNGSCITFLFPGWNVDTHTKYAIMLIGVLCMGIFNGLLTYFRHYLSASAKFASSILIRQICLSLIYGIQMVLAYWIMLLVMTYEVGVFIALIIGLMIGFLIFGYIEEKYRQESMIVTLGHNSAYQKKFDGTACCNTQS
jgi:solute carrier family 31 (copper transporter), member 1